MQPTKQDWHLMIITVWQSTFDNRKSTMRLHFTFFYKTKLKDINATMMKKWQNKLSEKYSNAYIRNIYGTFQMSLDLAVKLGLVQTNIAKQVGNVKKSSQRVDFWTLEEFQKVIATFDKNDYYGYFSFIFVWFMFMTGLCSSSKNVSKRSPKRLAPWST